MLNMGAGSLVDRLVSAEQPVTMDRYTSAADIAEAVTDGVLLLRCTQTRGTTELAFDLTPEEAGRTSAAIASGAASFEWTGEVTLDDEDLRVAARISTKDLAGTARFSRAGAQMENES